MKLKSRNTVKILQEPWWNRQCDQIKKENLKLLRQFRKTNDLQTLNRYREVRNKCKDMCKQKKLDLQKQTETSSLLHGTKTVCFGNLSKNLGL